MRVFEKDKSEQCQFGGKSENDNSEKEEPEKDKSERTKTTSIPNRENWEMTRPKWTK